MTPGRRIHFGEQVIKERRHVVAVVFLPSAVVNPGIRQRILRRWHGKYPVSTHALGRVTLAPTLDVDDLTGFGPIGQQLGD